MKSKKNKKSIDDVLKSCVVRKEATFKARDDFFNQYGRNITKLRIEQTQEEMGEQ